jgi:mannose-P-dolichol utilization defect protein 1
MDAECVKLLVSKALGYLVIAGSVGVKVPQILTIYQSQSAAGISLSMFVLELIAYTITLGYNIARQNPFSTWGENLFLLAQTAIILALMLHYSKNLGVQSITLASLWMATLGAMLTGQIPMWIMQLLQTASVGIFVMSKVPQVMTNQRLRSTGKLALLTFLLNTAGAAARVFTTLQEVPDFLILTSAILGFALNLAITIQIMVYGDATVVRPPTTEIKKKKD